MAHFAANTQHDPIDDDGIDLYCCHRLASGSQGQANVVTAARSNYQRRSAGMEVLLQAHHQTGTVLAQPILPEDAVFDRLRHDGSGSIGVNADLQAFGYDREANARERIPTAINLLIEPIGLSRAHVQPPPLDGGGP